MNYKLQIDVPGNHLIIFRPNIYFETKQTNELVVCLKLSQKLLLEYLDLNAGDFIRQGFKNQHDVYKLTSCEHLDMVRDMLEAAEKAMLSYHQKKYIVFFILSMFPMNLNFVSFLIFFINSVEFKVCSIIKNDISKKWSLPEIAKLLYMSPGTLKKRLSDENTSYTKIILDCRMRKAAELLVIHNKNVVQTADYCGYKSVSFFIAKFKKYYGTNPLLFSKEQ
ncbi:TPA: helix-turn-helix domain-containing protein [Salmonella enterica subsp. enterica serovar Muenchen]